MGHSISCLFTLTWLLTTFLLLLGLRLRHLCCNPVCCTQKTLLCRLSCGLCRGLPCQGKRSLILLVIHVLLIDQAFESRECVTELVEDFGCAIAISSRVVLRVHWIHDYKSLLTERR